MICIPKRGESEKASTDEGAGTRAPDLE